MNKSEFSEILSKKTKLSKEKCELFLTQMKDCLLEVCSKGEDVSIRNFGRFSLQEKARRRYLNPQTKRIYEVEPKKYINFKGFKSFKYGVK